MTARANSRPTYVVRLRGRAGADSIKALRAFLKVALRRHGLRCVSVRQDKAARHE